MYIVLSSHLTRISTRRMLTDREIAKQVIWLVLSEVLDGYDDEVPPPMLQCSSDEESEESDSEGTDSE